jgi:hypothetical protein
MKKLNTLLTASALLLATSVQANVAQNGHHLQVAYNLENSATVAYSYTNDPIWKNIQKKKKKKNAKKRLRRLAEEEYNEPENVKQRAENKRIMAEYHAGLRKKWEEETDPAVQKMFAKKERKNRKINKQRDEERAKDLKKLQIKRIMKKIKKEEKEYDKKMKKEAKKAEKAAKKAADARRGRK